MTLSFPKCIFYRMHVQNVLYFIYLFKILNRRVQFNMAGLNGGLLKTVLYK